MGVIEELVALGADVGSALERIYDDEELYVELLAELLNDFENCEVKDNLLGGDVVAATLNAHTLKGVTGNLGITPLYEQYMKINDVLKAGDTDTAEILLEATLPLQDKFIEVIKKYV